MKTKGKWFPVLKEAAIALALPVCVFVLMELLTYFALGRHLIRSALDVKNLIRASGISAAVAFALSMNLTSGRMDLSLGAQRIAGTIIGGLLAHALGLGGVWVLIFSVFFGLLFGAIVGIAFVTLRIPPMVMGIGMACILECVGFAASGGIGLRLVNSKGIELLSNVNFTIAVVLIMTVFVLVLMTYTTFSYKFRAVRGSHQIAQNAGINIFVNVALCYMISGGLVCVAGVLDGAFTGSVTASMGLGSTGSIMVNMFPMMVGCMLLSRYINQALGIVSASVAIRLFSVGLSAFNVPEALGTSINMLLYLAFLIWLFNSDSIRQAKQDKLRIAQAKKMKAERAAA